jgi:hypothetical protein
VSVTLGVEESALMTAAEPEKPQPQWRMRLYGVPCEYCWTPAKALVVFDDYRYVLHEDPTFKPCMAPNPKEAPFEPVLLPKQKAPLVKRKVGRPITSGKYTRRT